MSVNPAPQVSGAATIGFSLAGLGARGFRGFRSFAELASGGLSEVPSDGGVYVVVREPAGGPKFLATSVGGHFKGEDPTVAMDMLAENWVERAEPLYIGKANVLKRRIDQFVRFGQGKPVGHLGGRLIWQIEGSQDLVVAWKTTPSEDPEAVERQLIGEFQAANDGRMPFANLR